MRKFTEDQLMENFTSIYRAINAKRPDSIKGKYMLRCLVKTSYGRPYRIDLD
jgi:ribosomal protein L1